MTRKWSLFTKMVTFLALLLLAIAGLYGYTVATSINTVQQELETSRLNQLKFLADMLENDIDQLTLNAYNLLQDQSVRDYAILPSIEHLVDRNRLKMTISEKLKLQSTASAWTNTLTVYYPETGDVLSSDPIRALKVEYDFNALQPGQWTFDHLTGEFTLYVRDREAGGDVCVVLSFSSENIRKLLASYESHSRPYLYHPSGRFIFDYNMDSVTAIRMAGQLWGKEIEGSLTMVTEANGMSYLLNALPTVLDGWVLIEFTPLERILQPIRKSTTLFAGATAALLCLGVAFAFELYRNVQLPIRKLVSSLARFREGDYGVRIGFEPAREFRLLTEGFNEMAKRVGDLIDKVLTEQLRAKEAEFKQLQSQINPHFLYNCLFYIKSKARIGDTESVEAMALSLGEYYRYMTRTEKDMVPLRSELDLINNYVSILNLRKPRIDYMTDVSEELMDLHIPRLLLQPLVENAVMHGIEPKPGRGTIRITGRRLADGFVLTVEDDGVGMTPEALAKLRGQLRGPKSDESGCGVWNVQQRFLQKFGPGAVLEMDSKAGEGTTVTLRCEFREQEVPTA
ncbi:HAMP domain-containing protein,histidine kinase [Thermobacillus composti KWC4]|uniref:HAMP domain-containing protein,histidine kinase n=1 Tax=Thermobacillus composti (strain DSM 18247 / JCM 13945 / KWC4) TaxID=717605 RepID=L0EAN8_THECK|nr:sensor histidine kinase [Thermobacillus composti]AGA56837.1 HAMP domain-containing protein,histidine kinase [Thermobacillus composti KWC4]